jgi:hypothetical protein
MTESSNSTRKRPDHIVYVARQRNGQPSQLTRIGVGFNYKNGAIGIVYDAIPLSGHLIITGIDDPKPETLSHGVPTRAPHYEANLVRENGKETFWTPIGDGYRQDGYLSVFLDAVPVGKIILTQIQDKR